MKDRIKQIMDKEHLSPSAFADKLGLGRAVISHLLSGRNNPSLDVVTRILSKINNLNPEWLLSGEGNMYKNEDKKEIRSNPITAPRQEPDLFSQDAIFPTNSTLKDEYRKENIVNQDKKQLEEIANQQIIYEKISDKKISKIIIYYTDNTFEIFEANNKPL